MLQQGPSAISAGSHSAASERYRWEVPGKPIAIEIHLDVVERLDREVVQAFRSITSRGSEIGGLLLGRVAKRPTPTVIIENYELVMCDYRRGPLYLLADADRRRLEEELERSKRSGGQDLTVVGYFRSNTRKELVLDDEDLALIREYFPDRQNVFLLVKPFASRANLAGFFVWEGDGVPRESSMTFPFNRGELVKAEAALQPAASPATPAQPAVVRPTIEVRIAVAPPDRPVKADRASPVAESRAPEAAPAGPATPAPDAGKGAAKAEEKAPPADGKPSLGQAGPEMKVPGSDAKAAAEGKAPSERPVEIAGPPTAGAVPAEAAGSAPGLTAGRRQPRMVRTALAALLVAAIGLGCWLWLGGRTAGGGSESSSLALRVERQEGQLLLSWNRALPLLQTAQRAILTISDGDHREDVEMDLGQLRGGSVVYSPVTSDVSFRLEVTDLRNGKSVSESVRVLGGRPSPSGPPAENAAGSSSGAEAAPGVADAARDAKGPARVMALPPPPARGESLAARLSAVEPIAPAAPPAVEPPPGRATPPAPPPVQESRTETQSAGPAASSAPVTQPPAQPIQAGAAPASQPVKPAGETVAPVPQARPATEATQPAAQAAPPTTPAARPSEAPARVGGVVQEAKLIRRREPVYPVLARQARLQGTVRLEAVIGPDGRVEKVEAVSGPPLLRQAAVDAVSQWLYQPTMLNGQPVRVNTQIEVTFTLGR